MYVYKCRLKFTSLEVDELLLRLTVKSGKQPGPIFCLPKSKEIRNLTYIELIKPKRDRISWICSGKLQKLDQKSISCSRVYKAGFNGKVSELHGVITYITQEQCHAKTIQVYIFPYVFLTFWSPLLGPSKISALPFDPLKTGLPLRLPKKICPPKQMPPLPVKMIVPLVWF